MRTLTVFLLVVGDDAFLVCTLLLRRVTIIGFLPRINLTRHLIVEVGSNNFYATSCAVTLARLVLVVARQRTCILTRLPPHHRLIRRSKALNGAKRTIVRELTINRWLARLTIKRTRPLGLRLRQPTNVVRLLLQHETTSSNTRPSRTSRKVPRLHDTIRTHGVAARLHIASHNDGVLVLIWVLAPDTNLEIIVASQVEPWRIVFVGDLLRQVEGEAAFGVCQRVERRGNLALPVHILQVDDIALQRLVTVIPFVRTTVLVDVGVAVVAVVIAPPTLGVDSVWHLLVLALSFCRRLSTSRYNWYVLSERNRLRQWCHQGKRQCGRSNRRATTCLKLASHKHSFHMI